MASSVMVTAADLAPDVVEKVTLMVQLVLTARVAAQVWLLLN